MKELTHGKASTYNNHKCRCDDCRAAWREYIREGGYVRRYRARLRANKTPTTSEITQGGTE